MIRAYLIDIEALQDLNYYEIRQMTDDDFIDRSYGDFSLKEFEAKFNEEEISTACDFIRFILCPSDK